MIRPRTPNTTRNMPDIPKLPFGIKNRRRDPDEWDKTIVAFQSPYRLKDLCIDQSQEGGNEETRTSRQEFKVRLATTEDRRKSASLLIEKMYSWRGYDADALIRVLADPTIRTTAIRRGLAANGINLGDTTIARHRKGECLCGS